VPVPINYRLAPNEVKYIITDCAARLLVFEEALRDRVDAIRNEPSGHGTTGRGRIFSRSPALLAQSFATLDEMSNGRVRIGLGVSGPLVVERVTAEDLGTAGNRLALARLRGVDEHARPGAEGVRYVCDWVMDDLPVPVRTSSGEIYAMPHAWEVSDLQLILNDRHDAGEFARQVCDYFDVIYREAARCGGRIMALSLRPWLMCVPHRIQGFEQILSHVTRPAGVWSATGADILKSFLAQQREAAASGRRPFTRP
jgi:hypothetical protein